MHSDCSLKTSQHWGYLALIGRPDKLHTKSKAEDSAYLRLRMPWSVSLYHHRSYEQLHFGCPKFVCTTDQSPPHLQFPAFAPVQLECAAKRVAAAALPRGINNGIPKNPRPTTILGDVDIEPAAIMVMAGRRNAHQLTGCEPGY